MRIDFACSTQALLTCDSAAVCHSSRAAGTITQAQHAQRALREAEAELERRGVRRQSAIDAQTGTSLEQEALATFQAAECGDCAPDGGGGGGGGGGGDAFFLPLEAVKARMGRLGSSLSAPASSRTPRTAAEYVRFSCVHVCHHALSELVCRHGVGHMSL